MKNSIAVVTGGSSGLGEAAVTRFIESGGKAVILDLSVDKGLALVERFGQENVHFVKTEVTSEEEVEEALNQAVQKFGKITAVINCAGIGVPKGEFKKVINKGNVPHALWTYSKVIQVNLIGTFNVIRLAVGKMVNNEPNENGERGVIINTASIAAFEGQIGQVAYSASKGGNC
jgi:NAD(P)-dependent dehydrogenase (short-subunit alcohol dehydrogenase family)